MKNEKERIRAPKSLPKKPWWNLHENPWKPLDQSLKAFRRWSRKKNEKIWPWNERYGRRNFGVLKKRWRGWRTMNKRGPWASITRASPLSSRGWGGPWALGKMLCLGAHGLLKAVKGAVSPRPIARPRCSRPSKRPLRAVSTWRMLTKVQMLSKTLIQGHEVIKNTSYMKEIWQN